MKNNFKSIVDKSNVFNHIDHLEVGTIDLSSGKMNSHIFSTLEKLDSPVAFDLASITKVLTNGLIRLIKPDLDEEDLRLCLEHTSGIPAWGLLSKSKWKEEILSFDIIASDCRYSDYGAIRAMLIFEKLTGESLYKEAFKIWDKEVFHWLDKRDDFTFLKTGDRYKNSILGDVHDPNAFNVKEKLSHAGLFATTTGLLKTIQNIFTQHKFCELLISSKKENPESRFHHGWDTPSAECSLAGEGFSPFTFGHLGFTGTMIWVDLERRKAASVLSNGTRDGWYKKDELNKVRKSVSTIFWNS